MKFLRLNPELIQKSPNENNCYLLDLQTAQKPGHAPYQHWVNKYSISSKQVLALPDAIHECLMGKAKGIAGSQYDLNYLFQNFDLISLSEEEGKNLLSEFQTLQFPSQLTTYIPKAELKDKKILCILSHPVCGLRDLILIMPFLKIFAEGLNLRLSIAVNSAGINLVKGQNWVEMVYPEIMTFSDFAQFDYFIEPAISEMNSVVWIRNYLLKEFGERIFHNRFPCPEIKTSKEKINQKKILLDSVLKRDRSKKACLFSWESGSQRTNFSRFIWKAIVKSLTIMDHQIVVMKATNTRDDGFEWLIKQDNVINASGGVSDIDDLIALIEYVDFVIGPDSTLTHIAGSLRKKALCIIPKTADEIYRKSWFKGTYWPGKMDKLYPTVKGLIAPNGASREMEAIVYKAIREISFGHDLEMVDLYNILLSSLKNQKLLGDIEEIIYNRKLEIGSETISIKRLDDITDFISGHN